jgi:hypothetical protein
LAVRAQGKAGRQMNATMRASDHALGLRRGTRFGCDNALAPAAFGAPPYAAQYKPHQQQQRQQHDNEFHFPALLSRLGAR